MIKRYYFAKVEHENKVMMCFILQRSFFRQDEMVFAKVKNEARDTFGPNAHYNIIEFRKI